MSDLFKPEKYAATRLPLDQASNLPSWCYTSAEWHEREVETIFKTEWLCVGRVDQVPEPGDFYSIELIGRPLVVVRDNQRKVRVHSAICRHRGAVVAEGKQGRCRSFVCPYHSWTYDLDGSLRGTPGVPAPMEGTKNFDPKEHGLTPVTSETWAGFVFITFNPKPEPLLSWLGQLPAFLKNYNLEEMQFTHRDIIEVDCNWKIWLENAFENYHTATIHRKHVDRSKPRIWTFEPTDGSFEAMYSEATIVGYKGLPALPNLSEKEAAGLFHIWLRPSLQIIVTATYMKYRQYLPEGAGKLRLIENWTFPRSTVAREDFNQIVGPGYYDRFAEIIAEDKTISPIVHRGLASGAFEPGRYSLEEYIVHKLANYVLDQTIGPDRQSTAKQRPERRHIASV